MRFIDKWAPLIICVREGHREPDEIEQLAAGFGARFERRQRYAVLNLSAVDASPPSARDRQRIAEWANGEQVRQASRELCVGSATIIARAWERQALIAIQWLWRPAVPHQAMSTVQEGLDYCVSSLVTAQVRLPVSRDTFFRSVERGLQLEAVAGLAPARAGSGTMPGVNVASVNLEAYSIGGGEICLGWVGSNVLWARFRGRLSDALASVYITRLAQLLDGRSGVQFFVDASELETYELTARDLTTAFLVGRRQYFSRLILLNWAGGTSAAWRAGAEAFGASLEAVATPSEFERRLRLAAPGAAQKMASADRPSPVSGAQHRQQNS